MKVGLAQINPTVGDLEGNVERCLDAVLQAGRSGAELVVLPEMAIPGYPPRDILCDSGFVAAVAEANADLAERSSAGPPVLVGTVVATDRVTPGHPGLLNAAVLMAGGTVRATVGKRLLPAYDVFFEPRWFVPGTASRPIVIAGRKVGVLVCEDLWDEGYDQHPGAELVGAGAQLLVCLSASPFRRKVMAERLHHARCCMVPVALVNACGANDELIFDGRSFATDGHGKVLAMLPGFVESTTVVDLDTAAPAPTPSDPWLRELHGALVLGIRDFAAKNGLRHAFLGLSGGVDSALVAVLAAEALGPERVTAVAIPSRYTDTRSTESARELASSLGTGFEVVALEPLHAAAEAGLADLIDDGVTAENIQARLRMTILMAHVNRRGGFLLNTSNKTEIALGYGTLYGDLAGSLCPIADVTKPDVIALARWLHQQRGVIPDFILERPPSAELRPDQVDPFDYQKVAPEMEKLVRANRSDAALRRSEHKRWQGGVVLKVSERAFGSGRMIPITRR